MKLTKLLALILVTLLSISVITFAKDINNYMKAKVINQRLIEFFKTDYQDGDIIFQTSKSSQSKAIQLATNSKYSHLGIILENRRSLYVFEAVQPVKYTPLKEWINRGENSSFIVKRLKNNALLTSDVIEKMKIYCKNIEGKDYDIYFDWSDEEFYCSELVWKVFEDVVGVEIGKLQKLNSFNINNPIVKEKMEERYGKNIPLDQTVISPASIFDSEELIIVSEK